MDSYEATRTVFSRIQSLDPENAQKIMGYLLIQDLTEKDLIRLAFGPETILHNLILKAKTHLGLAFSTLSSPPSPSPLNPISRPFNPNPFSPTSPRINNGFDFPRNPSSPSALSGFPNNSISPKSSPLLSYENIRAGSLSLPRLHNNGDSSDYNEHIDEYFSFLNDSAKNDGFLDPRVAELGYGASNWAGNTGETHLHRRSYSASEVCFRCEDPGFGTGFKPCLYFARGFCKNGNNCKFSHGGFADFVDNSRPIVGSPSKFDGFEDTMKMKAIQQQRLASASQLQYNKYMNFLLQQGNDPQRMALMMEEELRKFGRGRLERNDFLAMGLAEKANSASRQIYLTFPADSTFKDEDVSEYFSIFGPVQDVRIPYQQKRMFGFVTFVHPETVKIILARGNPHFICDSRVLVKPYKEKGKVLDRRQQHQQQLEMGDFSACSSPSGLDSRESYDVHPGARMLYNTQEMMLRRKLEEQAELQQGIELQGRRLMNLQLPDFKNDRIYHHQRSLSVGAPVPLPTQPHTHINQDVILPSDGINQEVAEDNSSSAAATISSTAAAAEQEELNAACIYNNGSANIKEESSNPEEGILHESVGHFLPDSLFASPTKSAGNRLSVFSTALAEIDENNAISTTTSSENNPSLLTKSTSEMASH